MNQSVLTSGPVLLQSAKIMSWLLSFLEGDLSLKVDLYLLTVPSHFQFSTLSHIIGLPRKVHLPKIIHHD